MLKKYFRIYFIFFIVYEIYVKCLIVYQKYCIFFIFILMKLDNIVEHWKLIIHYRYN